MKEKKRHNETGTSPNIPWDRILKNSFDEIYLFESQTLHFIQVSQGALHNLGYSEEEIQHLTPLDLKTDFTEDDIRNMLLPLREGRRHLAVFNTRHRRKDGSFYPVEVRLQFVLESQPPMFLAIANDISKREQSIEALRLHQNLLDEAQRIAHIGYCDMDVEHNTLEWSDELYRILEVDPKQTPARFETFMAAVHPDDWPRYEKIHMQSIEEGSAYDINYRLMMKDGRIKYIHQLCEPCFDKKGKVARAIHTVQDVTEPYQTALTLQKLNRSLQALSTFNEAVMRTTDEQALLDQVCDTIVSVAGYRYAWVGLTGKDKSLQTVAQAGHLEETAEVDDLWQPSGLDVGGRLDSRETSQSSSPKPRNHAEWPYAAISFPLTENGNRFGVLNIYSNDSGSFGEEEARLLKRLVDNLVFGLITIRGQSERARLQKQLKQSQKMEAIGQLAGGIAHDYNNWLGVIMGYLDLLKDHVAGDENASKWLDAAMKGAEHSANLTRQLLAFSRQKATNQQVTDLNKAIQEMNDLIERSLTPEVEVVYLFEESLWPVEIDPNEFNDAVLNLVTNARAAMPNGGKLIIETRNRTFGSDASLVQQGFKPGEYVELSMRDTGVGMSKTIQARVFEPFYTTRPKGKGSGLGLSMVYGFANRYGGRTDMTSSPGKGATLKIILPRTKEHFKIGETSIPTQSHRLPSGEETLLIVDDETELLHLVDQVLSGLGYRTISAQNGAEALEILASDAEIDLLFSDVVMPGGMNGFELAQAAAALRPQIKILLTSGFTPKTAVQKGFAKFSKHLLSKPYNKTDLAQRIRYVLDNESGNPPGT
ncbi:MAG: PAS domain-containing protein [Nitrospiria bacterium]